MLNSVESEFGSEFGSWYDFHNFPRYDYNFHPAPNQFCMPEGGRFPNPWTVSNEYYQGIFSSIFFGSLFGLLFFAFAALWNLCKNRKYQPTEGARKYQNYIISVALIFTVVSLAFAISSDLEVSNVAEVLDSSYKKYKGMWDTANEILYNVYDVDDTLTAIDEDVILPATAKVITEMQQELEYLKQKVHEFLLSATQVHWYSGSGTLKVETTLILGQFTRFMLAAFVFWLLFIKPRWFYNTSLKSCGCVYILLNVALISIWIWCTVILVYTIIISDVCVDIPTTLNEIKNFFNLDEFQGSVVDYYTIGCVQDAVSPFQSYINEIQNDINKAELGLAFLQADAKVRGGDFAKQVDKLGPQFQTTNDQVTALENELVCNDIHEFYNEAISDICGDLKSDIFLCLIFQWAAILLTVIARTCKCRKYREREEVVVNEAEYFGEHESPFIISASCAPKLTEDLNANLLDVHEPGSPDGGEIVIHSRYRSRSTSNASRNTRNRSHSGASGT